jgi:YaiO family outer membrane protein
LFYGSLRETRRFSLDDQEIRGGVSLPLDTAWTAGFEGSASGSHKVLARWMAQGQLTRQLGDGWNLQGGMRRSEFETTSTHPLQIRSRALLGRLACHVWCLCQLPFR